jgi:imidazolonepropionase-like amidohydrolase
MTQHTYQPAPSSTAPSSLVRINTALLIPGRGQPVPNATLISEGSKIVFVGTQSTVPPQYNIVPTAEVPVLLPGLWDCHVHFFGSPVYAVEAIAAVPAALAGARSARDLAETLNAGFTSVRELGGYGTQIAQAVNEGWLVGPNIYSSVSMLSQTAGHGDARDFEVASLCEKMKQGMPFYLCDGVDECIRAVRTMVRRGASVIKVATTGGVASTDDLHARQFSDAELEAIVQEADRSGLGVAAHCHGKQGILAALRAGCRTLEHASFADDECIAMMKEKDIMLIGTRTVIEFGASHPDMWSPENYRKLLACSQANRRAYTAAIKAGVRVALGTDLGLSTDATRLNHGMNGSEFRYAVDAGMTALQAIEAGTANGPETLMTRSAGEERPEKSYRAEFHAKIDGSDGYNDREELPITKAPKSGQLKIGFDADFIALSHNPLDDINVLAQPEKVTHVWKGGKLYKAPSKLIKQI